MTLDPTKLLIVAIVALIVLGPDKLPVVIRQAAKYWAAFKNVRDSVQGEMNSALSSIVDVGNTVTGTTGVSVNQFKQSFGVIRDQIQDATSAFSSAGSPSPTPVTAEIDSVSVPGLSTSRPEQPYNFSAVQPSRMASMASSGRVGEFPFIRDVGEGAFVPGTPELN